MSVTINLRTLVAFATGLAVALIAVFVFQAWRVDAAPGDTDTTFVSITPCRLIDTRTLTTRKPGIAADLHAVPWSGSSGRSITMRSS